MNNTSPRPIAAIEMNEILSYLIVAFLAVCDILSINFALSPHEELAYLSGNIDILSISIEFGLWCYITTILYHRGTMPNWLRICILGGYAVTIVSTFLDNFCNTFDMLGEPLDDLEEFNLVLIVVLVVYELVVNALLARTFSGNMRTFAIVSIIFIVVSFGLEIFGVLVALSDDTDLVGIRFIGRAISWAIFFYYHYYRKMLTEAASKQETVESSVEQS